MPQTTPVSTANTDARSLPNFIYIGTSKAASTWLFNLLSHHPDVFMLPNKGLYFFNSHYDRGLDWYLKHFSAADGFRVRCEISHSYLYSQDACRRLAELNPDIKLMVCLREPVERAFSEYLDLVKNGRFQGSFEQALQAFPALQEYGRYETYLRPYYEQFGANRIFVAIFDDIKEAPDKLVAGLFLFLEVEQVPLSEQAKKRVNAGGIPRLAGLVNSAKWGSKLLKRLGLRRIVGFAKRSTAIKNFLFRPFSTEDRPAMREETRQILRKYYREEIQQLDRLIGTDLKSRWGYDSNV